MEIFVFPARFDTKKAQKFPENQKLRVVSLTVRGIFGEPFLLIFSVYRILDSFYAFSTLLMNIITLVDQQDKSMTDMFERIEELINFYLLIEL